MTFQIFFFKERWIHLCMSLKEPKFAAAERKLMHSQTKLRKFHGLKYVPCTQVSYIFFSHFFTPTDPPTILALYKAIMEEQNLSTFCISDFRIEIYIYFQSKRHVVFFILTNFIFSYFRAVKPGSDLEPCQYVQSITMNHFLTIGKLIIERTQLSSVLRTLRETRTTICMIISGAFIFVLRS